MLNSIIGMVGGGLGGQVLNWLNIATGSGGIDVGIIVGDIASGGVGGGILLAMIGLIKKVFSKK